MAATALFCVVYNFQKQRVLASSRCQLQSHFSFTHPPPPSPLLGFTLGGATDGFNGITVATSSDSTASDTVASGAIILLRTRWMFACGSDANARTCPET